MERRAILIGSASVTASLAGLAGCLSPLTEEDVLGEVTVREDYDSSVSPDVPVGEVSDNLVEYKIVEKSNPLETEVVADDGTKEEEPSDTLLWSLAVKQTVTQEVAQSHGLDADEHVAVLANYLEDTQRWEGAADQTAQASDWLSTILFDAEIRNTMDSIQSQIDSDGHIISPFQNVFSELEELGVFDEYKETVGNFEEFVNQVNSLGDRLNEIARAAEGFTAGSSADYYSTQYRSYRPSIGVANGIKIFDTIGKKAEIDWAYVGRHYFPKAENRVAGHPARRRESPMPGAPHWYYPTPGEVELIGFDFTSRDIQLQGGIMSNIAAFLGPLRALKSQFDNIGEAASELSRSLQGHGLPGSTKVATVASLLATLAAELSARVNDHLEPLLEEFRNLSVLHRSIENRYDSLRQPSD